MKRYLLSLFALGYVVSSFAVPADPSPRSVTLPDGTSMQVRLVGDEFHSYYISLDGTPLRRTESGFFEADYTLPDRSASLRAKRRAAQKETLGGGFPTTGSPRSLVLLVGFKDLPFAQQLNDFDDLLNKQGYSYNGANGSCRDYYIASSNGIFSPHFDVFGPYTLSHNMEYYGGQQGDNHDKNAVEMVSEACRLASEAGVNFKDYDTNNDGVLDNVFVYYAGHNQAEGGGENTIWPHQGDASRTSTRLNGVTVASYACTSEYKGAGGSIRCGIGTFCHEFGHVIGLPDFYDTNYKYYSVGNWDVMCSGSYNNQGRTPPTFTSYERFFEGWLTPEQLSTPGGYSLEDLDASNKAYLLAADSHNLNGKSPTPSEFFMLEYRDGTGWSKGLPGSGLLVWHIDYQAAAWNGNYPNNGPSLMRMHLEEANGVSWQKRGNGEDGRPSDAYPGPGNVTSWTPKLHNGTILNQPIFDIAENNGLLTFVYISSGGTNLMVDKEKVDLVTTVTDGKTIVDWEPVDISLIGSGLDPQQAVTIKATGTFYLFAGNTYPAKTSSAWRSVLTVNPQADSTINQKIWVSFRPTKQNCEPTSIALSIKSSSAVLSLPVTGVAPRPTYVSTPEMKPAAQVTPYSFLAAWTPVQDAEMYYLTLYKIENGTTDFVQSFEKFSDPNEVSLAGWQSNTNTTTSLAKVDGTLSLYMKEDGDYVITEVYPSQIKKVSYWINAFTAEEDTIGVLYLDARNEAGWAGLQETVVRSTTKQKTVEVEFPEGTTYQQFRLSFENRGGKGLALDAFTATAMEKITYVYRGSELSVTAVDDENYTICYLKDLTPATTYYCAVQCTDLDKGCEEHLTPLSDPIVITTLNGLQADDKHLTFAVDSVNYDRRTHSVYVSNPVKGDVIGIYDSYGHLVYSVDVMHNRFFYEVPLDKFTNGAVYSIKYMTSGSMRRKQQWTKFIF